MMFAMADVMTMLIHILYTLVMLAVASKISKSSRSCVFVFYSLQHVFVQSTTSTEKEITASDQDTSAGRSRSQVRF